MGGRRRAREQALQVLCLLDTQPELSPEQALALFHAHLLGPEEGEAEEAAQDGEQRAFVAQLVKGVRRDLAELDELIGRSSRNWRLERMNWVDRNLLRLAAFELRAMRDTPARVAINEAIELAKRFGTNESSAFVNGVLDRLLTELGRKA